MSMKIEKIAFGNIQIDGCVFDGSADLIIYWDKIEKVEKSHQKTIKDFEKIMIKEPEIVIFGTGFNDIVKIDEKIDNLAKKESVKILKMPTPEALKKFSELTRKGNRVAALVHTTC